MTRIGISFRLWLPTRVTAAVLAAGHPGLQLVACMQTQATPLAGLVEAFRLEASTPPEGRPGEARARATRLAQRPYSSCGSHMPMAGQI
jgi:hypothetical protein